jgi:predicted DsbA family dithiol-disulfide isomerase
VIDDRRRALSIGITGVPVILLQHKGDRPVLVSGAQPYGLLAQYVDGMIGQATTSA